MNEGISLALTTALKPAEHFSVDGEQYDILTLDHLSPDDEAEALALFARFQNIATELELTSNVTKGTELANRLRACRVRIICHMTTAPKATVERIPLSQAAKLVRAIQTYTATDEDEEEPGAAEFPEDGGS